MNFSPSKGSVFIVGDPRSGTTLLQYMLRPHPALPLPTGESCFIIPLYRNAVQYGDLSLLDNVNRVLQAMETQSAEFMHTDLHGLKFDVDTLVNDFIAKGRSTMRDIITGLFERNAAGERKLRWGDKTPYYVLHIPKLLEWWPSAHIIHIVRDGRDVALTMFARRHDCWGYNTYLAAKLWEQYVETGHTVGQQVPETQYLELRYKYMVNNQNTALQKICGFLGEIYSDDLLEYKKTGIAEDARLMQKFIQKDNQVKWKSEIPPWQIRAFESAAGGTLKRFKPYHDNHRPSPAAVSARILSLAQRTLHPLAS